MMQDSESDDFSDGDYEDVDMYCKLGGSQSPKQLIMKLFEKIISENHRDEFSDTSGRPSISPSPLRLTS
ncbi:hypothetical protein TNCV_2553421 [Trichonephila clavipes]|nr:hypothetical protein TNCV_2553421 [Trichonephila clavipes]